MNLSQLLQQQTSAPPTLTVSSEEADELAEYEIAVTLHLSPAPRFDQRSVIGAVGIPGHAPLFMRTAVGIANISTAVQTLYEQLLTPTTEPTAETATTITQGQVIATAEATMPATSQLDIF